MKLMQVETWFEQQTVDRYRAQRGAKDLQCHVSRLQLECFHLLQYCTVLCGAITSLEETQKQISWPLTVDQSVPESLITKTVELLCLDVAPEKAIRRFQIFTLEASPPLYVALLVVRFGFRYSFSSFWAVFLR